MTNHETATTTASGGSQPTAYIVRGECGREWRIPAAAVLADYKECISEMDDLDDAEMDAYAKEHFEQDQWWAEQCQVWEFVDAYGVETSDSRPRFRTKTALARNRGREIVLVRMEYHVEDEPSGAARKRMAFSKLQLGLAALAAGHEIGWYDWPRDEFRHGYPTVGKDGARFAPHADIADATRLAARLLMTVDFRVDALQVCTPDGGWHISRHDGTPDEADRAFCEAVTVTAVVAG